MTITLITDPKVLAIPIMECDEPLIDIKHSKELAYGPPPECELTAQHYTKMRRTVFEKLCAAQKHLPHGWHFRLYEGFRSLAVQKMLFDERYAMVYQTYPAYTKEALFIETTRLVSPVTNLDGTLNIPPHNTGAAVDVELILEDSTLIDMGMAAADWLRVDPTICETHCQEISPEAQKNRRILLDAMEAEDFVNYPTEWWHFSYGDRYWAYVKNKSHAIYDKEPPE